METKPNSQVQLYAIGDRKVKDIKIKVVIYKTIEKFVRQTQQVDSVIIYAAAGFVF